MRLRAINANFSSNTNDQAAHCSHLLSVYTECPNLNCFRPRYDIDGYTTAIAICMSWKERRARQERAVFKAQTDGRRFFLVQIHKNTSTMRVSQILTSSMAVLHSKTTKHNILSLFTLYGYSPFSFWPSGIYSRYLITHSGDSYTTTTFNVSNAQPSLENPMGNPPLGTVSQDHLQHSFLRFSSANSAQGREPPPMDPIGLVTWQQCLTRQPLLATILLCMVQLWTIQSCTTSQETSFPKLPTVFEATTAWRSITTQAGRLIHPCLVFG